MNITLSLSIVDELRASANFLDNHLSWSVRDSLKEKNYDKTQSIYLDLSEVKKENWELLEKLLIEKKYNGKTIATLTNWLKNLSNPKYSVITSLQMLEKTLIAIFKNSKYKWVLKMNPDGMVVPCAVTTCSWTFKVIDVQCDPKNEIERPPYSGVDAYDYNTYEEAMEVGLKQVLNQIKK